MFFVDANSGYGTSNDGSYYTSAIKMILAAKDLHRQIKHNEPLQVHLFESNPQTCQRLSHNIKPHLNQRVNVHIHNTDNANMIDVLHRHNVNMGGYGLVYFDPNKPSQLPVDVIEALGKTRIDVLINLAFASNKRTINTSKYIDIANEITPVKRHWFVTSTLDKFQWAMHFGCNYAYSGWDARGLYRVDSIKGEKWYNKATKIGSDSNNQATQLSLF